MTRLAVILVPILVLAGFYVFWLRDIAREHRWTKPFYDWIEPIETKLWARSKTLFVARMYSAIGFVLFVESIMREAGLNWFMLLPIDPKYQVFAGPALWATGLLFAHLRKITAPLPPDRDMDGIADDDDEFPDDPNNA
jgi:hypothetical protein